GRDADALAAFERVHALDPADEPAAMQRAYLLQKVGFNRAATRSFAALAHSQDKDRAAQSCAAWANLRGHPDKVFARPWFGEVDAAPEYNGHFDMGVLPVAARIGRPIDAAHQIDVYAGVRATLDTRSGQGHFGPQIYNDNALVLAAGVRAQPLAALPLQVFAEAGAARDLTDRDRPRWRNDVRGGFQFFQQWGDATTCEAVRSGFRPVADLYAAGVFYSRYNNNVLFHARARAGLRIVERKALALDAYLLGAAGIDTKGIADNRFEELGAGLALHFHDPMRLTGRAELVRVHRHKGLQSYDTARVRMEYQGAF
ncbi:MAG: hypothetical protein WCY11_07260, partial [Novosphingobium sp.]